MSYIGRTIIDYERMIEEIGRDLEKGSAEYREVEARLRIGPNTARERRVLARRRARLEREGHAKMFSYRGQTVVYMDTDSVMVGER